MSTYSNRIQPVLQMLFSEHPPIYASCVDDLGRNNRTTRYNNYNVLFGCSARENHSGFLPRHWLYK